jgi:hypothetical protein
MRNDLAMNSMSLLSSTQISLAAMYAITKAEQQVMLPQSPCDDSGRLCAAALLVHSALSLFVSSRAAAAFDVELSRSKSKSTVFTFAKACGLPDDIVNTALVNNDNADAPHRLSIARSFFEGLVKV